MKNIRYDPQWGVELPREIQLRRLKRVVEEILTPRQRQVVEAYYFEGMRPAHIARRLGVHSSTVLRTLRRAEERMRRHLTY